MLTFITPVVSREVAGDWKQVLENLNNTISSVTNQTNSNWRMLIVSQTVPEIHYKPDKIIFVQAPHPAARAYLKENVSGVKHSVRRRANDIDRMRKLRYGVQMLHQWKSDFVMLLEADDLISNKLCEFVSEHENVNGWSIDKGYVWDGFSHFMYPTERHSQKCGSSWIAKVDYAAIPSEVTLELDSSTLKLCRTGCPFLDHGHRKMKHGMAEAGTPIEPLPFRGAIYKYGHGGNLSKSLADRSWSAAIRQVASTFAKNLRGSRSRSDKVRITDELEREFAISFDA